MATNEDREGSAFVHEAHRAAVAFLRSAFARAVDEARAYFWRCFPDRNSCEELSFELLPTLEEAVTRRNLAELPFVDGIGFDELKQAGFIFAASGLERDGREMFGGEDTR